MKIYREQVECLKIKKRALPAKEKAMIDRPTGPSLAGSAEAPAGQSTEKGPAALRISPASGHPAARGPERRGQEAKRAP